MQSMGALQWRKQQGVSLILAIFILVVLSMLGAAIMNLLKTGADTVAREVLSARALLAAESGAQRQLNAVFPPGSTSAVTGACTAGNSYTLGGLVDCASVSVDCQHVTVAGINYFTITSTGRCGPASEQAVRVVEVQAKDGR